LWSAFKKLGLLSEEPVPGLEYPVTPRRFFEKLVEPKIRYKDEEKDLVIMRNEFRGIKNKKPLEITTTLKIERDLSTGLFAMSQGVGFTAAIVARMIVKDMIPYTGVLNPAIHIPCQPFLSELKSRGIEIDESAG
jgi:saccharopine dehydrogenase-like NADP-dependent oxidoreductase